MTFPHSYAQLLLLHRDHMARIQDINKVILISYQLNPNKVFPFSEGSEEIITKTTETVHSLNAYLNQISAKIESDLAKI
jgi:hypothetical protein